MSVYEILMQEKGHPEKNGLYRLTQILFAYNSNHIEGNALSKEQTRYIYETNSFLAEKDTAVKVNDVLDVRNHFRAFDYMLESFCELSESYIKKLHSFVKAGHESDKEYSDPIGDYKVYPNYIGSYKTTIPSRVRGAISSLLKEYNNGKSKSIEDIIDFHVKFERIHPFGDGNGRVGRLIMFGECLRNEVVPFIIDEEHRLFYYRGLKEYDNTKGYLIDTCLSCQDNYKEYLNNLQLDISKDTRGVSEILSDYSEQYLKPDPSKKKNKK